MIRRWLRKVWLGVELLVSVVAVELAGELRGPLRLFAWATTIGLAAGAVVLGYDVVHALDARLVAPLLAGGAALTVGPSGFQGPPHTFLGDTWTPDGNVAIVSTNLTITAGTTTSQDLHVRGALTIDGACVGCSTDPATFNTWTPASGTANVNAATSIFGTGASTATIRDATGGTGLVLEHLNTNNALTLGNNTVSWVINASNRLNFNSTRSNQWYLATAAGVAGGVSLLSNSLPVSTETYIAHDVGGLVLNAATGQTVSGKVNGADIWDSDANRFRASAFAPLSNTANTPLPLQAISASGVPTTYANLDLNGISATAGATGLYGYTTWAGHLTGGSTAPSGAAAGPGCGAAVTNVSVTGTDLDGVVTEQCGSVGSSNAAMVSFNFGTAFAANPYCVISPTNAATASINTFVVSAIGSITISVSGAPTTGTLTWSYHCMGQ